MTNETVIDPLQLVPHRIKAFKLIYDTSQGSSLPADDPVVSTRRDAPKEFRTKPVVQHFSKRQPGVADLQ